MHQLAAELKAIGQVLLVGGIAGIGLPVLFAVGLRAMAWGAGGEAELHPDGSPGPRPHPWGRVIGVVCFGVVLACAVLGLLYIVVSGFGKELSFAHLYPTVVDKQ